jgi:NADH-quinone oxidoreductase subunit N
VTPPPSVTVVQSLRYAVPEIALSVAALLVVVWDASTRARVRRVGVFVLAFAGLAVSAFAIARGLRVAPRLPLPAVLFEGELTCDVYACAFRLLFVIVTTLVILAAVPAAGRSVGAGVTRPKDTDDSLGETIALLLFACVGMSLMAMARTLLLVYLAIELVSIASILLTALPVGFTALPAGVTALRARGAEAPLEHALYSAVSSGVMLYGLSWIYGLSRSLAFSDVAERVVAMTKEQGHLPNAFVIGVACVTAGLAYKIAAAPFHMWAPDVFEWTSTLVAAFLAIGPTAAGFALLVRFFREALGAHGAVAEPRAAWAILAGSLALASMTLGNLSALAQTNMKRLLAYSGVAHAGTMLLAFAVFDDEGVAAVAFYLVAYCAMNLGAFLVVLAVGEASGGDESLSAFRGLGARAPVMAAAFAVFLVSLVGLPPFAGFVGNLYVLVALLRAPGEYHAWYWLLASAGVGNMALSLVYGARVLRAMYLERAPEASEPMSVRRLHATLALLLTVPTVVLGLWWGPFYDFLSQRVTVSP